MTFGKPLEVFCKCFNKKEYQITDSFVRSPALLQGWSSSFLAQLGTSPGASCGSPREVQGRLNADRSPTLSLRIQSQLAARMIILLIELTIATDTRHEAG